MIRSAFELTSNTVEWCASLSDHSPTSFVLGEDFDAELSGKGRRQRIDFTLGISRKLRPITHLMYSRFVSAKLI